MTRPVKGFVFFELKTAISGQFHLYLKAFGTTKVHHYPNCELTHWQYNESPYYNTHANRASNKPAELPVDRLNAIRAILIGQPLLQPLTEESFNKHTKFEDVWTIYELLEKCDSQKRDSWFMRIFRK